MSEAKAIGRRMAALFDPGVRVLVTGGASGIGAGLSRAFAAAGCQVTATGLSQTELNAADAGDGTTLKLLDVRDDTAIAAVMATFERLDVVVNCAGVAFHQREEFDPAVFATVLDVNLTGTMRVSAAARPLLAANSGAILTLASMNSFFGAPGAPGYASSKGGVVQLTKSLAIAWARDGIRVNAIAPGGIETPMTAALRASEHASKRALDRTPMRRWGTPDDLAGAALFLASPAAAFVTGAVLTVDGGYSIT
ncbi:SDR family oxidoreductase [Phenylobacterium sp.]|uniref:SDR family NAD(P)-dependent oxidoreductase n=1 Tax=Phenylobacterium sp. TaxID=1871053 RepID=UPI0025CC37AB|nr:SDR family oxidoreductase [Phenylobacterium sp.]